MSVMVFLNKVLVMLFFFVSVCTCLCVCVWMYVWWETCVSQVMRVCQKTIYDVGSCFPHCLASGILLVSTVCSKLS